MKTETDCSTDEGKAIALIDAIEVICKILSPLMHKHTPAIKEAAKDLHHTIREQELDILFRPFDKKEIENRKYIDKMINGIKKGSIKIKL